MPWRCPKGQIVECRMKDKSWSDYNFNKFLSRTLSPTDPNYQTGEDFNNNTADASIRSAVIGGKIRAKLIIVDDGVNDRVYLGRL
jgi:hypothetical protein